MARLEAIENLEFYPTDSEVLKTFFKKHISFEYSYNGITIFDPCVGDGVALRVIKDVVLEMRGRTAITYGVELAENRAQKARENVDSVFCGDAINNFSYTGNIDVIFMNPPYDDNDIGGRQELDWIDFISGIMTQYRTYAILVLPSRFFDGGQNHNDFRMCLWRNKLEIVGSGLYSDRVGAFQFPEPEYQKFKQNIIVVKKGYSSTFVPKISILGKIGETKSIVKIGISETKDFQIRKKSLLLSRSYLNDNLEKFIGKPGKDATINPLMPLRSETVAALIAGGMFTGIQIDGKIVRGGIDVEIETIEKESNGETSRTIEQVPHMLATFSILDMDSGDITTLSSKSSDFDAEIEHVAPLLTEQIKKQNPSLFKDEDEEKYSHYFSWVHAPRKIHGQQNGLFPAQRKAATMIMKRWNDQKTTILLGEMGCGKTITSIAAAAGIASNREEDNQKIIVLLPSKNDLVEKWHDEIMLSCREKKPKIFTCEKISDVEKAFETKGLIFLLIKESMGKRTSGWAYANRIERKQIFKHTAYDYDKQDYVLKHEIVKRNYCFSCGKQNTLVTSEGYPPEKEGELLFCDQCGISYTKYVRDRNGNAYSSIAKYIANRYNHKYILIVDEAHQNKGGDTARGYASHNFIKAAYKVLLMTGTFYNGYASSMFFNIFRSVKSFRNEWEYDQVKDFARLYGLEEKIITQQRRSSRDSWSGYSVKSQTKVREIPGIHPAMIALMLPYTVFLKLSDLQISLPKKEEKTCFLKYPDVPYRNVISYLEKVEDEGVREAKENGNMSVLSQYGWAKYAVWDTAMHGDSIENIKLPGTGLDEKYMKEEAIMRIVASEKQQGFPTLLFWLQTDRRMIHGRLSTQFVKHGMKLAYMPSSENKRVEFIKNALRDGADAILCNPNIVREGIDLLMFKTIVWIGSTPDPILVNQANARIYRIGQEYETKMWYLGYNNTPQSAQWEVTAKKIGSMQAMHADVRSGLAAILGDNTLISDIQKATIEFDSYDSDVTIDDLPEMPTKFEEKKIVSPERKFHTFGDGSIPVRANQPALF